MLPAKGDRAIPREPPAWPSARARCSLDRTRSEKIRRQPVSLRVRCLIGIDDTDNLESRGTGFRARELGGELTRSGRARTRGITRHQLLVHPDVRYTSHNSAACLDVEVDEASHWSWLVDFCREYLLTRSAPGSDAGLCVARVETVDGAIIEHGRAAKLRVLTMADAERLADGRTLHLEGLTGDHGGVIGALAAVGLRRGGQDGRFIWVDGVRELTGTEIAGVLLERTGIESIETVSGEPVPADARIRVDPWPRPVLLRDRAVLLARPTGERDAGYGWEILSKDEIRRY